MINYIKYTLDGKTYNLTNNGDGTWSKEENAPSVSGNYSLVLEINEDGISTFIDSQDIRYNTYLKVIEGTERKVHLVSYLPYVLKEILEFRTLFDIVDLELDQIYSNVEKTENNMVISKASNDAILRLENFLNIKGQGTLEQRKSYLLSLIHKGKKLNEQKIKDIANTITGSDCIITFFGSDQLNNPELGNGLLRVQVLSPDGRNYRYEDIERALKLLIPAHIKLVVIKYFALWDDVKINFADWNTVKSLSKWETVKNYIPPL